MFQPYLINAWIVATIVAAMAGTVGFFVVVRGNTFEAHTIPLGAFPGAAAATLLGTDQYGGLLLFSLGAVAGITGLGRHGDRQVATAMSLVMLLALGALFLSWTTEYSPAVYALLFGELLGVTRDELLPVGGLAIVSVALTAALFRPLLLETISPELATVRGCRPRVLPVLFLTNVALAASACLPVVGALLVFTLMVGPASAARAMTDRPLVALLLSAGLALVLVWAAVALSILSDWPVGFFVGALGAVCYVAGRVLRTRRRRGDAPERLPALGTPELAAGQ